MSVPLKLFAPTAVAPHLHGCISTKVDNYFLSEEFTLNTSEQIDGVINFLNQRKRWFYMKPILEKLNGYGDDIEMLFSIYEKITYYNMTPFALSHERGVNLSPYMIKKFINEVNLAVDKFEHPENYQSKQTIIPVIKDNVSEECSSDTNAVDDDIPGEPYEADDNYDWDDDSEIWDDIPEEPTEITENSKM